MPDPMTLYLCCAWLNIVIGCCAAVFPPALNTGRLWGLATLVWTVQMAGYFTYAGIYSLSGIAPTFGIAALVLCCLQLKYLKSDHRAGFIRPRVNAVFLLFLACASLVTEEQRHNGFMMTYVCAVLFFLARPLSLGLVFHALGGMPDCLSASGRAREKIWTASRDAAFLGAIFFLAGEIAGCYWGFMAWGTTWRWSGNFHFSAMVFVLFMVSLHVPRSLFSSNKSYAMGFFGPLILIVLAVTLSKVVRP